MSDSKTSLPIRLVWLAHGVLIVLSIIVVVWSVLTGAKASARYDTSGACDPVKMARFDKQATRLDSWVPCTDEQYLVIIKGRYKP